MIIKVAGLPRGVADGYSRHMASVRVVNSLNGAVGEPYSQRFSIPQGCPWSMTFLTLFMHTWTLLMRGHNVRCRTLADDLMDGGDSDRHETVDVASTALRHRGSCSAAECRDRLLGGGTGHW